MLLGGLFELFLLSGLLRKGIMPSVYVNMLLFTYVLILILKFFFSFSFSFSIQLHILTVMESMGSLWIGTKEYAAWWTF